MTKCPICEDKLWVCEEHPYRPWESGSDRDCDCGAAGKPCVCNPEARPIPGSIRLPIIEHWNN